MLRVATFLKKTVPLMRNLPYSRRRLSTKEILTNEAFRWDPVEDKFFYSGKSYVLERIRAEKDLSRDQITTELRQRQRIIDHMNENNIRGFRQVAHTVSRYIDNPKEVLDSIEKGSK